MTVQSDMALLAAGSYWDIRKFSAEFDNSAPLPDGWTILTRYDTSGSGSNSGIVLGTGFSARVYRGPEGQIVISFGGTEFGNSKLGFASDFLNGNIPLAVGQESAQATAAAKLYRMVKAEQGDNIAFTGHSLGGGLAAVMAVWFDRPAYVFAPAPFELAAKRTDIYSSIFAARVALGSHGQSVDPSFANYDPGADFEVREKNVQAWAVKGEVLEANLGMLNWIEGRSAPLYNDPVNALPALTKHSIDLHAAALITPNFETQANKLPTALGRIFDDSLYGYAVTGNQQDFLVKLIRNEVGVRSPDGAVLAASNGMLTHFSADLQKLGTNVTGLNRAAQDALIAQGIEWYYWQTSNYSGQEFFTGDGALLQYTSAQGAGLLNAQNKAALYTGVWLATMLNENRAAYSPFVKVDYTQWNVVASTNGASATALDPTKTQIFVGNAGVDLLTGGEQADVLFGNAGSDSLIGAGGDDKLYGGEGVDAYAFGGTFGKDMISDLDGLGYIQVDGQTIGQTKAAGKQNVWTATLANGQIVGLAMYDDRSSSTGKRLVITRAGNTDNTITIDNFNVIAAESSTGYLGIKLDPTQHVALIQGSGLNFWSNADADFTSLNGKQTSVGEGTGCGFSISLGVAAKSGDTITLGLNGGGGSCKAILGAETVDVNGATITLAEGQTEVSFAFIQDGELDANTLASLTATYHGADGQTVVSNSWGLALTNRDDPTNTLAGDFTKQTDGATHYLFGADGNYLTDPANPSDPGAADLITGTDQGDHIQGLAGNDALLGRAGDDSIEGGDGDDILQGGLGADTIEGGAGDDMIYGSSTGQLSMPIFVGSHIASGSGIVTAGFNWYVSSGSQLDERGQPRRILSNTIGRDEQFGDAGNVIDAGDGADDVYAGTGSDRVDAGAGDDLVFGMGGDDVLLGEDGDDYIAADGPAQNPNGEIVYTPADQQGRDFVDGGDGDDTLLGQGNDDVVYGGAGDDDMFGDDPNLANVPASAAGNDYLDGEDGNDVVVGGGKDDTIYGGSGGDELWGDGGGVMPGDARYLDSAANGNDYLDGEDGNDSLLGQGGNDTLYGGTGADLLDGDDDPARVLGSVHGNDYLDGEEGNDTLIGGGGDDTLYGGADDDQLTGDRSNLDGQFHGSDYLDGEEGNDTLTGGGGDDTLYGGAGDDRLDGDRTGLDATYHGNDYLDGEDGDDQLVGGGGDDTLHFSVLDDERVARFSATLTLGHMHMDVNVRSSEPLLEVNLRTEIKTGQRRVIEFLLSPIQRAGNESLRER